MIDILTHIGHMRPMNALIIDSLANLGGQIRARRLAMGLTQADAAGRAGVAYRTWRRMEKDGSASIEDLLRAAIALRCEQGLTALFPEPATTHSGTFLPFGGRPLQQKS
jgi:transcriptional regulator with XRE-family HTH domain